MAWIESHQELAQHPKTRRLKRALGVSLPTVIGHLHMLWWWAMEYADDGDLSAYSDEDIADAVSWDGDAGTFTAGLSAAGFLDADRRIHDWEIYIGRLLEKRRVDADRKRKARGVAAVSSGRPLDVQRTAQVTVTVPEPLPEPLPEPETGDNATTAVVAMPAAAEPSVKARQVLDWWRTAHGRKKPPRLNPVQLRTLEDAIPELGMDRLEEAVQWSAQNGVPEFIKCIRGAYTKRQHDEEPDHGRPRGVVSPGRNGSGAHAGRPASSRQQTSGADMRREAIALGFIDAGAAQ